MTNDPTRENRNYDYSKWREEVIPLAPDQPVELTIDNPNGDVTVRATERAGALLRYQVHGLSDGADTDESGIAIEVSNNRIELRTRPARGGAKGAVAIHLKPFKRSWTWGTMGPEVAIDIIVELPQHDDNRISVATASGEINVADTAGQTHLSSAAGDVFVTGASGSLSVKTASGDVKVGRLTGSLALQTASGELCVTTSSLTALTTRTASGDCAVNAELTGDGACELESVSGDVGLELTAAPAADREEPDLVLAFQTLSGDARVDAPFRRVNHHTWQTGNAETGRQIRIKTVSGDLHASLLPSHPRNEPGAGSGPAPVSRHPVTDLISASDATPDVAVDPSGASSHLTRLAILEAVERGELAVEEALKRLGGDAGAES